MYICVCVNLLQINFLIYMYESVYEYVYSIWIVLCIILFCMDLCMFVNLLYMNHYAYQVHYVYQCLAPGTEFYTLLALE